jgi:hypothetical protein
MLSPHQYGDLEIDNLFDDICFLEMSWPPVVVRIRNKQQ